MNLCLTSHDENSVIWLYFAIQEMLLLCTSIPLSALKILPINESAPHCYLTPILDENSNIWLYFAIQKMLLLCTSMQMSGFMILSTGEAPHQ
jgi:hypothetical protein